MQSKTLKKLVIRIIFYFSGVKNMVSNNDILLFALPILNYQNYGYGDSHYVGFNR